MLSRTSPISRHTRALFAALFSAAAFSFPCSAAQGGAVFIKFCATCSFHGIETFTSQSQQFVVHGSSIPFVRPPERTNNPGLVDLDPQLCVVSAERTKRALCQELTVSDTFADKVHISVLDRAPVGQPVAVVSQIHLDGFVYKIGVPSRIDRRQFARGLMQVTLLEFANRGAQRCAELPQWLVEGMTRQCLPAIDPAVVPQTDRLSREGRRMDALPVKRVILEQAGYDRLALSRAFLQTNAPLAIQDLSFPISAEMSASERERFEASSHLLVHRLLALRQGPRLMAQFLQSLPRTLNWQTALFAVYKQHFDGPLALEKWWMLNWMEFRKREAPEYWPAQTAIERLDAVLLSSVEVRSGTNDIPSQRLVTMQDLIQNADYSVQRDILSQKIQQMFFVSVNVPADVLPLWSAYQRTLDTYLQKRNSGDLQPSLKSDPEQRAQAALKSTLKTLDELDFARNELKAGRPLVLPKAAVPRDVSQASR